MIRTARAAAWLLVPRLSHVASIVLVLITLAGAVLRAYRIEAADLWQEPS